MITSTAIEAYLTSLPLRVERAVRSWRADLQYGDSLDLLGALLTAALRVDWPLPIVDDFDRLAATFDRAVSQQPGDFLVPCGSAPAADEPPFRRAGYTYEVDVDGRRVLGVFEPFHATLAAHLGQSLRTLFDFHHKSVASTPPRARLAWHPHRVGVAVVTLAVTFQAP